MEQRFRYQLVYQPWKDALFVVVASLSSIIIQWNDLNWKDVAWHAMIMTGIFVLFRMLQLGTTVFIFRADALQVQTFGIWRKSYPFRQMRRIIVRSYEHHIYGFQRKLSIRMQNGRKTTILVSQLKEPEIFLSLLQSKKGNAKWIEQDQTGEVLQST